MGLFEHWPYVNFHDLNLDWIIKFIKDADAEWTNKKEELQEFMEEVQKRLDNFEYEGLKKYVDEWLEEHPEATTTVQDGSLTRQKFTSETYKTLINNNNAISVPQYLATRYFNITDANVPNEIEALTFDDAGHMIVFYATFLSASTHDVVIEKYDMTAFPPAKISSTTVGGLGHANSASFYDGKIYLVLWGTNTNNDNRVAVLDPDTFTVDRYITVDNLNALQNIDIYNGEMYLQYDYALYKVSDFTENNVTAVKLTDLPDLEHLQSMEIADGLIYFVSNDPRQITVMDLDTLQIAKGIPLAYHGSTGLNYMGISDIEIHSGEIYFGTHTYTEWSANNLTPTGILQTANYINKISIYGNNIAQNRANYFKEYMTIKIKSSRLGNDLLYEDGAGYPIASIGAAVQNVYINDGFSIIGTDATESCTALNLFNKHITIRFNLSAEYANIINTSAALRTLTVTNTLNIDHSSIYGNVDSTGTNNISFSEIHGRSPAAQNTTIYPGTINTAVTSLDDLLGMSGLVNLDASIHPLGTGGLELISTIYGSNNTSGCILLLAANAIYVNIKRTTWQGWHKVDTTAL